MQGCGVTYELDELFKPETPNCFYQVSVNGEVKDLGELSESMFTTRSNHFIILKFDSDNIGPGEELRQTPPLECRCTTVKRIVLSTIQIENYYSK
ncbi:hypothetical protein BBBOND_0101750 [Babesia bigemina]|uniref:6-Cys domain-containing protein n=1 Tax=Babesia bigemina TaxID=5866 RepID=A0A061CZ00_BABBI|nr:hypothetical protein BBBOND_0101750 [Babesia bigemina]CDR93846.1 hypothetical protein BBBOND_0101750 [Babesia bigemina]|eukprot:XP_012766032.1 hypothetical protein BBBOND_0101750 [Babesia bigemina]